MLYVVDFANSAINAALFAPPAGAPVGLTRPLGLEDVPGVEVAEDDPLVVPSSYFFFQYFLLGVEVVGVDKVPENDLRGEVTSTGGGSAISSVAAATGFSSISLAVATGSLSTAEISSSTKAIPPVPKVPS